MAQLVVLEKGPLRTFQQIPRFQFLKTVRCLQVVGCCQQKQSQKVGSNWEGDGGWGGPQLMIYLAMWFFLVRFFMSSAINRMVLRFFKVAKGLSKDDSCLLWRNLVWNRGLAFLRYFRFHFPKRWCNELVSCWNRNRGNKFEQIHSLSGELYAYMYTYIYIHVRIRMSLGMGLELTNRLVRWVVGSFGEW